MAALPPVDYDRNVFVNCPFDDRYKPILNAIVFCIAYMDFKPRVATERIDSGEPRILKIMELIGDSRFGIHDLSRSESVAAAELARHNMPLELGIDLGCRRFGAEHHRRKAHLILDEKPYRHQAAISDLSNSDIAVHGGKAKRAIRPVRNFLAAHAKDAPAPAAILDAFADFQAALFVDLDAKRFSRADIRALPLSEYLGRIHQWKRAR